MKNKIKKIVLFLTVLSLCIIQGGNLIGKSDTVYARGTGPTYNVLGGVTWGGSGPYNITIQGKPDISLNGKKFNIYKILSSETSDDGLSINYSVNTVYKNALEDYVISKYREKGKEVPKKPMHDEVIVDYIKSITKSQFEKDNSEYRKFVEEVRTVLKNSDSYDFCIDIQTADSNNSCIIKGLYEGYYIIDEDTNIKGKNSAASLCIVTDANTDTVVNLKADYPKISKKICEDDKCNDIADPNGWNDIGDYEIGQDIPYRYVSTIPEITGYSKYYYCWHDKLDPCIEFYKDTLEIEISGTDNAGKSKTYKLLPEEYVLSEPHNEYETFSIEINDIKAIVDREFNKAKVDNVYGQKVTLKYTGALKNEAAKATGRPGFENDVCLEFSNDPDSNGISSKGKTPWDTVVCFTYKLNINKVNEQNKGLKGAIFKLYEDKECTKEITVCKEGNIYVVNNKDYRNIGDRRDMISNENGEIVLAGLDGGTYYIKETKAPKGYAILTKPVVVKISPKYTSSRDSYVKTKGSGNDILISIDADAHIEKFFQGLFRPSDKQLVTDVNKGEINMDILNKTGKNLPRTGTSAGIIIFVSGTICMVTALVIKNKNKKRKC